MANEKRLIDAMDTVTKISKAVTPLINSGANDEWVCQRIYDKVLNCIAEATTVDTVEVVRGRWLYDSGTERHFCSACNEYALSATTQEQVEDYDWEENLVFHLEPVTKEFWTDYCPNCGAKMDGDGNGTAQV